ncbi:MAG TPA: PQQ-dependent sugar dehydrogenase [Polyangiales bacterium]|nr:PQQ-dependent sugar dehydrogenase [Polyangiales bacterium]
MHRFKLPLLLCLAIGCKSSPAMQSPGAPPAGPADRPFETLSAKAAPTDEPNAAGQKPAFAEQTRAPSPADFSKVKVETIATGLDHPWGVEALSDGRFVITEKSGSLRVVGKDGRLYPPLSGVPKVVDDGQGGLLDVAVAEGEDDELTLCLTYSEPRDEGKNATAAACATATGKDNLELGAMKVIFRQEPAWESSLHFGSRFIFAADDLVYITTGERSIPATRGFAQDTSKTLGKVIRLKRDGSAPKDNPFADQGGPAAQVWSYGHRNLQSAALDAQGRLWTVEHGPRGGDELNRPQAGKNYGWPIITYGEDYSGDPIGDGITQKSGMEQPIYYWDPVIAPSGMLIYSGELFADWRGSVLIGGLASQALVRLTLQGDRVTSEERISFGARIRDITQGPDGAVYLVTDESDGKLLRLSPA